MNSIKLLQTWQDHSQCYRVLHSSSSNYFDSLNTYYKIPAIIITGISAALAFSIQIFPEEVEMYIPVLVGVFNLVSGTFNTVASFLKVEALTQEHLNSSIQFSKLQRRLVEKLTVSSKNISKEFVSQVRTDFDELVERGPNIPIHIIKAFLEANPNPPVNLPTILRLGALEIDDIPLPGHKRKINLFSKDFNGKILSDRLKEDDKKESSIIIENNQDNKHKNLPLS